MLREARPLSQRADKLHRTAAALDDPTPSSSLRRPAPAWSSWCAIPCGDNVTYSAASSLQLA